MKAILYCILPESKLYSENLRKELEADGFEVEFQSNRDLNAVGSGDIFVSHHCLSDQLRQMLVDRGAAVVSGTDWVRSDELRFAEFFGIECLDWAEPKSLEEARHVVSDWGESVYKTNGSAGTEGVSLVTSDQITEAMIGNGIFSRALQNAGLYKIEAVNGIPLIEWHRESQGLEDLKASASDKQRMLWHPDPELIRKVCVASRRLAEMGIGHCSFDFLAELGEEPKLIEINLCNVALWYTTQQSGFCEVWADAMSELVREYANVIQK